MDLICMVEFVARIQDHGAEIFIARPRGTTQIGCGFLRSKIIQVMFEQIKSHIQNLIL